jgi:elongation factor P
VPRAVNRALTPAYASRYSRSPMGSFDSNDLRKGKKILVDNQPYTVLEAQFVKPGKGAAFIRTKMKNLLTGGNIERNIRSGEKIDEADVEDRQMSYLYKEGEDFVFMDQTSYEQTTIAKDTLGDQWKWLKDNMACQITFYNNRPIEVTLPNFVQLKIVASEPGARGDTSGNVTKPATLETGAVVGIPLFVNEGEIIKIDTRTGEYIERVKG